MNFLGGGLADFLFQSTPPVKAATLPNTAVRHTARISIHAAREGGDRLLFELLLPAFRFQSTPPVKAATIRN